MPEAAVPADTVTCHRTGTVDAVRCRGLRLAGIAALVATVGEVPHAIQDVHRGVVGDRVPDLATGLAVVALVAVAVTPGLQAIRSRTWNAVPLAILGLVWATGSFAVHPTAFTDAEKRSRVARCFFKQWPGAASGRSSSVMSQAVRDERCRRRKIR